MQDKLRELSAALGHGGVEIYPKQREILVDRNDVGSWLNMPYFGGDGSTRYGVNHKGESLTMIEFLAFVESRKISRKQLVDITVPEVKDIDGGPPCLKVLLKQGFPEGTRNNGLFNVGGNQGSPTFSSLAKLDTDPPLWFLSVSDRRLELTTEQLQNQMRFQRVCMEQLNMMPPRMNERQWQNLIQHLMDNGMEIIEVGTDASIEGQFMEFLESFCTDLAQASVKEEILLGKPWNKDGSSYFRLKDLKDYLTKHRFTEMDTNKIAARLRDIGAEHHFWNIRKKGWNIWEIPAFEYDDEPLAIGLAT